MALDLDVVKKAMDDYIGSEAHIKQLASMRHKENLKKRNIEKIRNMSVEERYEIITKVYNKYSSKEYQDKELKAGYYEYRCSLYDVILDYAAIYGQRSMYNCSQRFNEEQYDIDGKYIIGVVYGQGSFVYMKPITDTDVIPHDIKNLVVTIYKPNDEKLIRTDNPLVFNDIRLQIKNKNLKGYYVMFKCVKYYIEPNGKIKDWPKGLFDIETEQLSNLIKPKSNE